ncbi:MAG TPA: ECF-type sigma factor, partial [Pirellulaceae bacterium]
MEHDAFLRVLDRVRGGDQDALGELVEDYEPELRLVARNRLGPALRPYLDSMDLVQTVNKSFILGLRQRRYEISSRDRLMALVGTILRRKVARQWRKHRRQIRDSRGERCDGLELADVALALQEHHDDPAALAIARDELGRVLSMLDESDRALIQLRLEGHSTAE